MTILRWVTRQLHAAKKFATLAKKEMVGHSGNVVADDSMGGRVPGLFRVLAGHAFGMVQKKAEQRIKGGYGAVAILGDCGVGI